MEPAAYPSSEDTYLLLDVLRQDETDIRGRIDSGGICIEIGLRVYLRNFVLMSQLRILVSHLLCQKPRSGSGEVSAFLNNLLGRHAMLVSTDVNAVAIQATRLVVDGERSDVVRGDLFSFFQPKPFFDVIVFNPPYVPTDDDEYQKSLVERDISASWAGGQNGREVTDRFLRTAMPYLRENGVVYLVVIELNDVDDTIAFATNLGYQCDIAGERAAGIEKLYVLRLQKNTTRL